MSNEVNATKANEAPTCLADGTYQPVLTVSDLDRCGRRWMLGASIYNYESQCAPAVMFATEPALRKINYTCSLSWLFASSFFAVSLSASAGFSTIDLAVKSAS